MYWNVLGVRFEEEGFITRVNYGLMQGLNELDVRTLEEKAEKAVVSLPVLTTG